MEYTYDKLTKATNTKTFKYGLSILFATIIFGSIIVKFLFKVDRFSLGIQLVMWGSVILLAFILMFATSRIVRYIYFKKRKSYIQDNILPLKKPLNKLQHDFLKEEFEGLQNGIYDLNLKTTFSNKHEMAKITAKIKNQNLSDTDIEGLANYLKNELKKNY